MIYTSIEECLGQETVGKVEEVLERAFIRSRMISNGPQALTELLIAHLAAVIAVPGEPGCSVERAEYCGDRLLSMIFAMAKVSRERSDLETTLRETPAIPDFLM